MKDFIFAVEDSRRWHEANIATNGGHYSGVAWLGSSVVARLQEEVGASIYYNTHVQLLDEVRNTPKFLLDVNGELTHFA
jgi:translocator assembly and maintenance protein 41